MARPCNLIRVGVAVAASITSLAAAPAQVPECKGIQYENRNQIDYAVPLRISGVRGFVQDTQKVRIPHACVGIFTEPGHKLVAASESNESGEFDVHGVPNGDYRIVVKYDSFCSANALICLAQRSGNSKPLIVHMRPAGIDVCSYIGQK